MAILKIVTNTEFLRKKSKPVEAFDARLHQLLDDMRDTFEAMPAAGLAAVQVGVLYRICLVMTSEGIVEFINPEFTRKKRIKGRDEACLSIPGNSTFVRRPTCVSVRAFDRFGEMFEMDLKGFEAVVLGHEVDHLDGILITDYDICNGGEV